MAKLISSTLFSFICFSALPALAANIPVSQGMQRCSSNAECTMFQDSCANPCSKIPVSQGQMEMLARVYEKSCNRPYDPAGQCSVKPEASAVCLSGHCTISIAYEQQSNPQLGYQESADWGDAESSRNYQSEPAYQPQAGETSMYTQPAPTASTYNRDHQAERKSRDPLLFSGPVNGSTYDDINDRTGNFTAYDLPDQSVRTSTLGVIQDQPQY